MLITWEVEGHPHYASMSANQRIAYISDIGAEGLKPLFNAGCIITTLFLDAAFLSERWLRHKGRLARNTTRMEKALVGLSLLFALIGTLGLILLSFFDTLRHPSLHRLFLLFFMGGYVVSAIFICWEYQRLGVQYRQHRILRMSFWTKLAFIVVEVVLAIAYGSLLYKERYNPGAVLEWVISLIFTFYILTFLIDLLPAVRSKHPRPHHTGPTEVEMGVEGSDAVQTGRYANGEPAEDGLANGPSHHPGAHADGNGVAKQNGVLEQDY